MSTYDNLATETMNRYNKYYELEDEEQKHAQRGGINTEVIMVAITELKACNHTLNDLEYEYEKLKLEHEINMIKTMNSEEYVEKYKTLKQREQEAKIEHLETQEELLQIQRQIREIKSNKEGLEYEIRFYFKTLYLQATQETTCNCNKTCEQ